MDLSGYSGYFGTSGYSGYKGIGANTTLYEFTDVSVLNPSDDPGSTYLTTNNSTLHKSILDSSKQD
jgi:hypothetical protein